MRMAARLETLPLGLPVAKGLWQPSGLLAQPRFVLGQMATKLTYEAREAVLLFVVGSVRHACLAPANAQPSFSRLFCTVEPAPLQPGLLMDACKYLESLQYRVWKKMLGSVESGKDATRCSQANGDHPVPQRQPSYSAFPPAATSRHAQGPWSSLLCYTSERLTLFSIFITLIFKMEDPTLGHLPQGHSDSLLPVCPGFMPRNGSGPGECYLNLLGVLGACELSYFLVMCWVSLPWLL